MKKLLWAGVLVLSLVSYAAAIQDDGLFIPRNDMVKNSFVSGNITYALYAPANVNVFRLVKDVNLANGETADSIRDKVNAQRKQLYPSGDRPQRHAGGWRYAGQGHLLVEQHQQRGQLLVGAIYQQDRRSVSRRHPVWPV